MTPSVTIFIGVMAVLFLALQGWLLYEDGRDRERSDAWWRALGEPTMKEWSKQQCEAKRERRRVDLQRRRTDVQRRRSEGRQQ